VSIPPRFDPLRLRVAVERPIRSEADFVLYWMTSARRLRANYALDRAIAWARELRKPLVVLEGLRLGYRWASERHHAFVLQGMSDNRTRAAGARLLYYPYVETVPGEGSGLVAALARHAAVVVGDEFPAFFLPRMIAAAAQRVDARLEVVDSNGLMPLRAAGKTHLSAYSFRRFLQSSLRDALSRPPDLDPLVDLDLPVIDRLPGEIAARWLGAPAALLAADAGELARLPLDHRVSPVRSEPGGARAAERRLGEFLDDRLARYADERNHPDADAASGLSPYLHFGHLSPHEVLAALADREGWSVEILPRTGNGGREGWWGMSRAAEAFLDELVTWREVGFNFCHTRPDDYDRYDSLPEWARTSLERHAADRRPARYPVDRLASAESDDELWNAAQRELVATGRIHNYLRMLWGKRVLEWTASPREAVEVLVELNNRFALDGRDPNSYSGIFWCLGRYDRPWAPERPIFGVVRYMSSANTRRKLKLGDYLRRWSAQGTLPG